MATHSQICIILNCFIHQTGTSSERRRNPPLFYYSGKRSLLNYPASCHIELHKRSAFVTRSHENRFMYKSVNIYSRRLFLQLYYGFFALPLTFSLSGTGVFSHPFVMYHRAAWYWFTHLGHAPNDLVALSPLCLSSRN